MNQTKKTAIFIILFTLLISQTVCSEDQVGGQNQKWLYEIRMGILAHDVPIWSRFSEEFGVDLNAELVFGYPDYSLFSGVLRTNLGISVNTQGDTSKIYSGVLWEYVGDNNTFLNLGLGIAVHDGKLENGDDRKELGSRLLFRVSIELGMMLSRHHGISIMFDHVSNANLFKPNEGLDTLGLRYTYRF